MPDLRRLRDFVVGMSRIVAAEAESPVRKHASTWRSSSASEVDTSWITALIPLLSAVWIAGSKVGNFIARSSCEKNR